MERPNLRAEVRETKKKGGSRKLRAQGRIPAIFYGPRTQTVPLMVGPKDLSRALQTEAGENVLIDLDIQNADGADRRVVMVKDLQIDPLQNRILHADFYEVSMDEMVTVEIPIHLVGKSEGVKLGGILEQVSRTVEIQCLPGDIPRAVELDVSSLKIGDSIHVEEIQLEKVKILSDPGLTVATVVPPVTEEKEVAVPAEAEAVEAVEEAEEEKEEKKEEAK